VIYAVGRCGYSNEDDDGDVLGAGGFNPKDTGIRLWSAPARKQPPIPYEPEKPESP
jgi:hypothetical protein